MVLELEEGEHISIEERFGYSWQDEVEDSPAGQENKTQDLSLHSVYAYNNLGELFGSELDSVRASIGKNFLVGIMPGGQKMRGGEMFSVDGKDYAWSSLNNIAYRLGVTGEKTEKVFPSVSLHKRIQSREVGGTVLDRGYHFLIARAHDRLCVKNNSRKAIKLDHPLYGGQVKDGRLFMSNSTLRMWYDEMVFDVFTARKID